LALAILETGKQFVGHHDMEENLFKSNLSHQAYRNQASSSLTFINNAYLNFYHHHTSHLTCFLHISPVRSHFPKPKSGSGIADNTRPDLSIKHPSTWCAANDRQRGIDINTKRNLPTRHNVDAIMQKSSAMQSQPVHSSPVSDKWKSSKVLKTPEKIFRSQS